MKRTRKKHNESGLLQRGVSNEPCGCRGRRTRVGPRVRIRFAPAESRMRTRNAAPVTAEGLSASFWSKSVAGGCPMLGQDRDNDIARVDQDGFLLVRRELDEAQSPEQEKSFNGQQSVTNVMGIA
jgi:hypothetical protein